ncbi:hypothetical protein M433DRAFT_63189 [Acidomyces richmondensis BFW]|nr:MAG: hypothetical protein FE78DRAFT_141936 [Acidomyces sp. 'richmondensis']KYG47423.1 hypothetical protein M433DRAFT_63189 [Acidomyces richmondensis BFW]
MAYDQNSTYEPPRRAYYGQAQHAPVQYGYSEYSQDPNHGEEYENSRVQDYGYGHQPYEHPNRQIGYSADMGRREDYSNGYHGGYGQSHTQMRPQQQQNGRAFDPRYQQHPGNPMGFAERPPRGPATALGPADFQHDHSSASRKQFGDAHLSPQTRPLLDHKPFSFEPLPQRQLEQHSPPSHQDAYPRAPRNQPDFSQQRPQPQQRPSTAGGRSQARPIDTSQNRQPVYMDHEPLSPAFAPPRPSSAQGVPLLPNNPDALPQHPTPVRPGLMEGGGQRPVRPPPVRNYDTASVASSRSSNARKASIDLQKPVTHAELDALRADCAANPGSYSKSLLLAKKLVEAGSILANEGGRVDARTAAKNREKYILDAYKRVKKLVTAGYPEAQFYLADCYGQGLLGLEPDTKEAFNLYQAAAKQNHAQAAYRTAVCCEMGPEEGGGTRKDLAKALQWYRRAAALGETAAMYKVGIVALKGLLGQPRNVGDAIIWLNRAADRADDANPHAIHELATLYESANTDREVRNKVIADDKYACELFQKAASLGLKQSQFRLGQAYEYGHLGLPIDNRQSIAWYSKAAAQGEHQAELALSGWYLTGAEGILEHNDTEAYLWARKAACSEPPLPKAMFAMGYFSEQGIGCPASIEEARRWYGRAATHKFPKALERLEELKKSGKSKPTPANGKLTRKDQKRDEENCVMM